ncbi:MAG: hypothetical protein E8D46_17700 [Nitrospira sp.]|nr:MAG: hypothetical protein E8D46_17700 [Nitrospira sp.]
MVKPQQIDELQLHDHFYLTSGDICIYLREYTPRQGYEYSETNRLIHNFKKSVDRKGKKEYYYKEQAIDQIAREIAACFKPIWLQSATLVPIPPSKTKTHAMYDDRMTQVLKGIGTWIGGTCDVRELIVQTENMEPVHLHNDDRPTPDKIRSIYEINEDETSPQPKHIGLFDDVITAGSHFRAAKDLLQDRFPEAKIVGVFVARRVPLF